MARYIDADKLLVRIKGRHTVRYFTPTKEDLQLIDIFEIINTQPTADVAEVNHGEWKQGIPYICSVCGKPAPDEKNTSERYSCWTSPYCPHCGAKMDGGKTE